MYSPMLCDFTQQGAAPTSAPSRQMVTCAASHPRDGTALFDASSAWIHFHRTKGTGPGPASASQSAGATSVIDFRTRVVNGWREQSSISAERGSSPDRAGASPTRGAGGG